MRLAYLDPHAVPDEIPEALQILYTVDALGRNGIEVELITPPARRDARSILGRNLSDRVHAHPVRTGRGFLWVRSNRPFYHAATAILRGMDADAVLVRNLKMAEYLLREVPNLPLFFETHELFVQSYREEHPQPGWRERRKLAELARREGFVYRHARGLIALTPLLIEDIRKEYGVDTPAVVAPDGVDLEQAKPPATTVRTEIPVLLYLGSLHPWKGVDKIIRSMPHVKNPAVLHIVGGTPRRIEELKSLAGDIGAGERVIFEGPVDPGRRFEWIHRADICLLPLTETSIASRYTSPLKLFEYMAAGKAIIVSDLPSMRLLLENGRDAFMTETGDPASFAAAIDRLLSDSALRGKLAVNAGLRAKSFSWSARAQQVSEFINKQLESSP